MDTSRAFRGQGELKDPSNRSIIGLLRRRVAGRGKKNQQGVELGKVLGEELRQEKHKEKLLL